MPTRIRIGHLNLQSGAGITKGYWQYIFYYFALWKNKEILLDLSSYLKGQDMDIMAFTEIDLGSKKNLNINQPLLIAQGSGLKNYEFYPTFRQKDKINQGNAIHSRQKIIEKNNFLLPGKGQTRFLAKSVIKIGKKKLNFFVTHLSLDPGSRKKQIEKIKELIGIDNPTILVGDFNIRKKSELRILENTKLKRVIDAMTFPSWKPRFYLDHIFLSDGIHVTKTCIHKKRFSDHLMCSVDVEL